MAMPAAHTDWTVELLDELPDDGNRYELLDGLLLVTPAPSDVHQLVASELTTRLAAYLRTGNIGRPLISPADVRRADRRRNRLQPDVFVVKLRDGERPEYPYDLADLLLAVEIVSPSSVVTDYQRKRDVYVGANVEYWVVDPDARTVAVWSRGAANATLYTDTMRWQPEGMSAALSIHLPELFVTALS